MLELDLTDSHNQFSIVKLDYGIIPNQVVHHVNYSSWISVLIRKKNDFTNERIKKEFKAQVFHEAEKMRYMPTDDLFIKYGVKFYNFCNKYKNIFIMFNVAYD